MRDIIIAISTAQRAFKKIKYYKIDGQFHENIILSWCEINDTFLRTIYVFLL
jgi:hypothetical protein